MDRVPQARRCEIGRILRDYRMAAGLTQDRLAELAGMSVRGLGDVERGRSTPRYDTLNRMAAVLALSPERRAELFALLRGTGGATLRPTTGSLALPPLLGRDRVLAQVDRYLAGNGSPVLVLVGEPGVGKTRLLDETARRAKSAGWTVMISRTLRGDAQEPYSALRQALLRYIRGRDSLALGEQFDWSSPLTSLLPELAGDLPTAHSLPHDQQRAALMTAVTRFLRHAAGPSGTLLILDDLQWADDDTLGLVSSLVQQAVDTPVYLAAACREMEVHVGGRVDMLLTDLARTGLATQETLHPLSAEASRTLLDALLRDSGDPAPGGMERILERAGGVPFYLVRYAQALRDGQRDEVPWEIARTVRQRVAALSREAQEVLQVAAFLGRVIRPSQLVAGAREPEERVEAAVDEAMRAHLLIDCGHDRLQFSSDVTREVIRADLAAGRRTALRWRVSQILEGTDELAAEKAGLIGGAGRRSVSLPVRGVCPPANRHNLPARVSTFVGREVHLDRLRALLCEEDVRLVTLTGPAGVGKTRLALELARKCLSDHPEGVFFIELADVHDPALVLPAIASVLGASESDGLDIRETVKRALGTQRLLLLLDNFEHLIRAGPDLSPLLASCPYVTVLVTSRETLHLYGEHEYPVPPLALPGAEPSFNMETTSACEAIQLFLDRVRSVQPHFDLTTENVASVVEICRKLDGLPLAIELAAARVRLFSPQALLQRLSNRTCLLTGGSRDHPARQRTLRGSIDWSYSLLSREEQRVFSRLSVFAGGCSLEAAEAVCNQEGTLDVTPIVQSLLEKSMLQREEDTEPRVRMLQPIREYAREILKEGGDGEAMSEAHSRYFLSLVESAEPELWGPKQGQWFIRLEYELDNLRDAMGHLLDRGARDEELRLASALYRFWFYRCHWREGQQWLERGLQGERNLPIPVHARALVSLGRLIDYQGEYARARGLLEGALGLFADSGDRRGVADTQIHLGVLSAHQCRYREAIALIEEGVRLARSEQDRALVARGLNCLSVIAIYQGDLPRAREYDEEALTVQRSVGDVISIANTLIDLADIAAREGKYREAEDYVKESLDLAKEWGQDRWIAYGLAKLGELATQQGQMRRAGRMLRESLLLAWRQRERLNIFDVLRLFSVLALAEGKGERAATLKSALLMHREREGLSVTPTERPEWERDLAGIRASMSGEEFARARDRGERMTLEEAVTYALETA